MSKLSPDSAFAVHVSMKSSTHLFSSADICTGTEKAQCRICTRFKPKYDQTTGSVFTPNSWETGVLILKEVLGAG